MNDPEWLTVGAIRPSRRGRRGLWWACAAVLAILLMGWVILRPPVGGNTSPAPSPSPPGWSPTPAPPPTPGRPSTVTSLRPGLLGVGDGWELYARGATEVVRVEFAAGRVTRTPVPELGSPGPVSFLVAADTALVSPLDHVPGYAVPDGQTARPLQGTLAAGPLLPGPTPDTVWQLGDGFELGTALRLVRLSRSDPARGSVRRVVRLNRSFTDGIAPDGRGSFVYRSAGDLYLHRPVQDERIPGRTLLAAGRKAWLVADCPGDRDRCRPTVIDRATGKRRTLPLRVANRWLSGAMSPDARYAALAETEQGKRSLRLVDLTRGRVDQLPVSLPTTPGLGVLAWSPDSRYLFAVGRDGAVRVIEASSSTVVFSSAGEPALQQLAVSP